MTPEIVRKIVGIIEDYHVSAAAAMYGEDAVSAEQWQRAIELGIVDPTDPPEMIVQKMHSFGIFLGHESQIDWHSRYGQTAEQLMTEIRKNPVPLTVFEQRSNQFSRRHAARLIVGLGNKVGAEADSSLVEADRRLDREMRNTIQDVVSARFGDGEAAQRMQERGIDRGLTPEFFDDSYRSTAKRMSSDMGHATGDWARDFDRIAQTESERAVQEGLKDAWMEQEQERAEQNEKPVEKVIVYKLPRPDACKNCLRLHLEQGFPRLFDLAELSAAGTNYGLKVADWRAVVGPIHPYCGCTLIRVPRFVRIPSRWRSGHSVPSSIGVDGEIVTD